jgi:RNA polymerase sigma-70 factor (ECF subfamily)
LPTENAVRLSRFESSVLVHLDSAHNLARWLLRSEHDAQDVVQEACLRAFRAFDTFRGATDGRCWLLAIVRNTCCTFLDRNRKDAPAPLTDEDIDHLESDEHESDPQRLLIRRADAEQIRGAIEQLPPEFREAIILRELEGLSYKEISSITGVPIGTVMSRLARARKRLEERLAPQLAREA